MDKPEDVARVLQAAREIARGGTPVLINALVSVALLGKTDFRKGSISM